MVAAGHGLTGLGLARLGMASWGKARQHGQSASTGCPFRLRTPQHAQRRCIPANVITIDR
jgi:hypothetical protein